MDVKKSEANGSPKPLLLEEQHEKVLLTDGTIFSKFTFCLDCIAY